MKYAREGWRIEAHLGEELYWSERLGAGKKLEAENAHSLYLTGPNFD
jgi:hypothetical protein